MFSHVVMPNDANAFKSGNLMDFRVITELLARCTLQHIFVVAQAHVSQTNAGNDGAPTELIELIMTGSEDIGRQEGQTV